MVGWVYLSIFSGGTRACTFVRNNSTGNKDAPRRQELLLALSQLVLESLELGAISAVVASVTVIIFFLPMPTISIVTMTVGITSMKIMESVRSARRRGTRGGGEYPLMSSRPCLLRVTPVQTAHPAAISLAVGLSSRGIGSMVDTTDTDVGTIKQSKKREEGREGGRLMT